MEIEGIGTIKDDKGNLVAIVFTDLKKRSQIFFNVKEMGQEDVKNLFANILKQNEAL